MMLADATRYSYIMLSVVQVLGEPISTVDLLLIIYIMLSYTSDNADREDKYTSETMLILFR